LGSIILQSSSLYQMTVASCSAQSDGSIIVHLSALMQRGSTMKQKALISIVGLVVVAMGAVLVLRMFAQRGSPAPATAVMPPQVATAVTPVPTDDLRMNRVVQNDDLTTLVISLRNYCGDARNVSPNPQNQFVSVEFVIGNQGSQTIALDLRDAQIITEDDKVYPLLQAGCVQGFAAAAIPANGLARGQLVFDIPAGEKPKLLRYTLGDTAVIAGLRY
jgi:hypothetical protein